MRSIVSMGSIRIGMAVAISLFLLGTATAAPSEWNMTLTATSQVEPVTFGISPSATNSPDPDIDEGVGVPSDPEVSHTQMALIGADTPWRIWINKDNTTWALKVTIYKLASTTIVWTPADLPDNLDITINDTDMRTASSIELTGNLTGSVVHNLTITTDTTAPVITNVANGMPGSSSVLITWDTDENSSSLVKYGTESGNYTHNKSSDTLVTSHSITLTGLTKGMKYYFVVNSTDRSGNSNETSVERNFTTGTNPAPAITSWSNNKTNNDSMTITINESESVRFNATANQTITTWHWYNNGTDQLSNFDNYTTSWSVNGINTISVNATNANGTSNTKTWTITVNDITAPAQVQGLANDTTTVTTVDLSWTANTETDLVGYRVYRNGTLLGSPAHAYYNATGLQASTTYEFNVSAYDDNDLEGENASVTVTTATAAPSEWNMTLTATSQVEPVTFGISPSATNSPDPDIDEGVGVPSDPEVSHTQMALIGADTPWRIWINKDNTTWALKVTIYKLASTTIAWTPADLPDNLDITINDTDMRTASSIELTGNSTGSVVHNLTITTDTTAPVITNVANGTPGSSSALITWDTDENSSSLVKYGTESGNYTHNKSSDTLVTSHSITLTGLTKGMKYYFVVNSTDRSGNSNETSVERNFTTGTNPAPAITSWSNNKTNNDSMTITINESESVRFNATANQTITTWHWYNNGTDQLSNFDNYTTSWSVNGINTISVNATNANGTSNTKTWTITVNDIRPPAPVTGLVNDTTTVTTVDLSWTANTETDLVGYRVYRNGTLLGSTSNAYYNATGLLSSTTYEFNVSAYDDNGLEGENASIVVTTAVGPFHHIDVMPTSWTMNDNESRNFTATGRDQNDGKISGLVFAWSRSDAYIGSLTEINDTTTNFTAEHVGITYLTARNGSVTSGQVQVTVNGAANNTNVTNETVFTATSGDATVTGSFTNNLTGWINTTAIGNATNSSEVNQSNPRYGLGSGDKVVSGVIINVSGSNIRSELDNGTIRIQICYNATTLDALGIDASTLAIWKYDNATEKWVKQSSTLSGTCVYVDVKHLGTFALIGSKATGDGSTGGGGGGGGGGGAYPPGWFGTSTVTATKASAATTTATGAAPGEHVTPAPTNKPAAAKAAAPAAEGTTAGDATKGTPGFTAVFAIAGMLALAYVMMRRRG